MSKYKLHKIVAVSVLIATGIWVATGQFSYVGSAQLEAQEKPAERKAAAVPRKSVQVAIPPQIEHARMIRVSGETAADKESILASRASGVIEELAVTKGVHVKQGDLILRLESEGKEAALASARQTLTQRQAEAAAAERLAKSGSIASLQLDAVRTSLSAAQSALELAQADLNRSSVYAPFDGVVDRIYAEQGSAVQQGAQIATLLKLDPIMIVGEVSERELGNIQTSDKAYISLVNGDTVQGTLRYVSRAASPQTRTFRIEVDVPNPDTKIPAGMTAEIAVQAKTMTAVALPRSVIALHTNGDIGVRSVDEAGTVLFHPVEIIDDTTEALYVTGVPEGASIIVAGQDFVVEGDIVDTQPADVTKFRSLVRNDDQEALR